MQLRLSWLGVIVMAAACRPAPGSVVPVVRVRPGVDVLVDDSLHLVSGRRVGLVSNQAGVDRAGAHAVDRLLGAGVRLVALFSPEHGFRGAAAPGEAVASTTDSATGLPIYSLYGATNAPSPEMLAGLDVVLVDLQDVGARYYTWLATTVEVMRVAAQEGKPVIVLDRPNPIGGAAQGNVLDPAYRSAVGRLAMPMRHGLTLGELARLARLDLELNVDLRVVPAAGWRRRLFFDQTGLPFIPPSPNLRDLEALFHYPGLCLFEGTALSVGRGTDLPFHQIGAPWLDTAAVLLRARAADLPGVDFTATTFTPVRPGDGKFADVALAGIRLYLTDAARYDPVLTAVTLLGIVHQVHPDRIGFNPRSFDRLAGGPGLREGVSAGVAAPIIADSWRRDLGQFARRVQPILLYPE